MGASLRAVADPDKAGVVDKVAAILDALEPGPTALSGLMASTGLPRATAHRLAVALGRHGLVGRDDEGRFVLGLRLIGLGQAAGDALPLRALARPALEALRDETGESVQLYVAERDGRRCVLSLQSPHGLRWIVPEGALLPLDRGSAGRVLSAGAQRGPGPGGNLSTGPWPGGGVAAASRPGGDLSAGAPLGTPGPDAPPAPVSPSSSPGESPANRRAKGSWVESVEEREAGVASVSAPVHGADGALLAAVSVSGPIERLTRQPGQRFGAAVVAAASAIEAAVAASS